jgi:small GTP-binding protein
MPKSTDKMVLLGNGEVGKSSLITQLIHKKFYSYYYPTIDDIFRHWMEIDGEWREIELLDTADNERFSVMRDHFIRKSIVFCVVQSILIENLNHFSILKFPLIM